MCNTWTTTDTSDIPIIPNETYQTEIIYDDQYRKSYEEDLKRRQEDHLKRVQENYPTEFSPQVPWQPCMHDQCSQCQGTGIKHDGTMCVHMISCPCPKCSVYC